VLKKCNLVWSGEIDSSGAQNTTMTRVACDCIYYLTSACDIRAVVIDSSINWMWALWDYCIMWLSLIHDQLCRKSHIKSLTVSLHARNHPNNILHSRE